MAPALRALAGLLYNAKQYDAGGGRLSAARSPSTRPIRGDVNLARRSRVAAGTKPRRGRLQQVIQARTPAGKKAERGRLQAGRRIAYKGKSPNAVRAGREWVAAYPSPDSWHNTIAIYRNLNQPDVEGTLDLLASDAGRRRADDAGDYALYRQRCRRPAELSTKRKQCSMPASRRKWSIRRAPQFRDMVAGA